MDRVTADDVAAIRRLYGDARDAAASASASRGRSPPEHGPRLRASLADDVAEELAA